MFAGVGSARLHWFAALLCVLVIIQLVYSLATSLLYWSSAKALRGLEALAEISCVWVATWSRTKLMLKHCSPFHRVILASDRVLYRGATSFAVVDPAMFSQTPSQLCEISADLQLWAIAFAASIDSHRSPLYAAIAFLHCHLALIASLICTWSRKCLAYALSAAQVISAAGRKAAGFALSNTRSLLSGLVKLVINFESWTLFGRRSLLWGPHLALKRLSGHRDLHFLLTCWSIKTIWLLLIEHNKTWQRFLLYIRW